jgi:hypothetical protein
MKPEKLILEFEELVQQLGYRLRKERGNFRGDNCVLDGEKIIMLNKNQPVEIHLATLARFIMAQKHDELFIKPAVRKELEALWDRIAVASEPEFDFNEK